jgi:hypothetical protein
MRFNILQLLLWPKDATKRVRVCLEDLTDVPVRVSRAGLPLFQPGATEAAIERLETLRERERQIDRELADYRRRLGRLESLQGSVSEYERTLTRQTSRVRGLGWFREKLGSSTACPVCGSRQESARSELERLGQAAEVLAVQTRSLSGAGGGLARERILTREGIRSLERDLRDVRRQREELENETRENEGAGQRLEEVYRFVGKLEQALETMQEVDADGPLTLRLIEVEGQISEIDERLDEKGRRIREERALATISQLIGHYASFMNLERSDDNINIRKSDLHYPLKGLIRFGPTFYGRLAVAPIGWAITLLRS